MMRDEGVSVFIPVYNEAEILRRNTGRVLAYMGSLGMPFEVIIGSNGSTDQTVALLRRMCKKDNRLKYFHIENRGVGAAFKRGARLARYPRMVTVDMDLSIDLDFIPAADRLLERNHIVIGSKVTGDQRRPYVRKAASNLFIRLAGFLLKIEFQDYSIGAKGYRTELIKRYLDRIDQKTFYVVEIIHRASRDGYRIVELPVACHDMRGSRFNLVHEGVYKFGRLFRLWLFEMLGSRKK